MNNMTLKNIAILFGFLFFGAQFVKAQASCLTLEQAQRQTLTADQQTQLVQHIGAIFNNLNNHISWSCFAEAIAQFIDEHDIALKNPRFGQLSVALKKTSGYNSSIWIGYELQNFKDLFANDPTTTDAQILAIIDKRINFTTDDTCKTAFIEDLYKFAHPNLCVEEISETPSATTSFCSKAARDDTKMKVFLDATDVLHRELAERAKRLEAQTAALNKAINALYNR